MPRLRIPLAGSYTNRNDAPTGFLTKDQFFTNCFPEVVKNPITGAGAVYLYKRGGHAGGSALTGVASSSQAMCVWTGSSAATSVPSGFVNTGGTSTSVWDSILSTKIGGDIANTAAVIALTETIVSGTANLVGNFLDSGTGATEQWYFPEGGAWTQVTDSDFPSDIVGAPAHLDGYVLNMTSSGRVWNSDINSVSSYTANNFHSANAYQDRGVGVARMSNIIVAFSEKSTEFLVNAGNPTGSPLRREGSLNMGCARRITSGAQTYITAHDTVYWMGTNSDGAVVGVYRFKGTKPEKISTPAVDKLIGATGTVRGFYGVLVLHGMRHIALDAQSAGTLCYCLDTNYWWRLTLATGTPSAFAASAESGFMDAITYMLSSHNATRNIFTSGLHRDEGVAYTMTAQTDNVDAETDKTKFWDKLHITYDRQSTTSEIGVSWSDDDYGSFSTVRNIDTSTAQSWISGLGSAPRRAFKFTHSANTACRIKAVEIDYRVGSR